MKLKDTFIIRKMGGKCVAVPTGRISLTFKGMITLSPTAEVLFNVLKKGCDGIDDLANALCAEYDVTMEKARADSEEFVEKLRSAGLIED
ncbi:MAG: PqqD family protein [Ruminococcaceae bacterium]|nr:PqqD family protein [Oscillospiraceae bacterium]